MKYVTFTALCLGLACIAADKPMFSELPESPAKLIEKLQASGNRYTILGSRLDYVKETDIPYLVGLLDSKEPCAFVDLAASSIDSPGRSTVGREAAYLIEGFWKRYYPPGLTSRQFHADIEPTRQWYRMWSHLRKLAQERAAEESRPIGAETNSTPAAVGSPR